MTEGSSIGILFHSEAAGLLFGGSRAFDQRVVASVIVFDLRVGSSFYLEVWILHTWHSVMGPRATGGFSPPGDPVGDHNPDQNSNGGPAGKRWSRKTVQWRLPRWRGGPSPRAVPRGRATPRAPSVRACFAAF